MGIFRPLIPPSVFLLIPWTSGRPHLQACNKLAIKLRGGRRLLVIWFCAIFSGCVHFLPTGNLLCCMISGIQPRICHASSILTALSLDCSSIDANPFTRMLKKSIRWWRCKLMSMSRPPPAVYVSCGGNMIGTIVLYCNFLSAAKKKQKLPSDCPIFLINIPCVPTTGLCSHSHSQNKKK